MTIESPDTMWLSDVTDVGIPNLGRLSGALEAGGDFSTLEVHKLDVETVSTDGLAIRIQGRAGEIRLTDDFGIDDAHASLEIHASSTASLVSFTGEPIPDLGPLHAAATLSG